MLVLPFRSSLRRVAHQLRTSNQEEGAFSKKDVEVGRRLRVYLTEVRRYLVDTRMWMWTDQRAGGQSIDLLGEEKIHVTDIFHAQRYNLSFPSIPYESDARMQSVSWIDPTLLQDLKACCCSVPSSCKKAESTACLTTHRQERSLLPLQWVDVFDEIRIGEQWVEGEEGGVQRDHRGCEHRRTTPVRATVQLGPEPSGKHSRAISRTSDCFILTHMLLWSSGQLWITSVWHIINMFWFFSIL